MLYDVVLGSSGADSLDFSVIVFRCTFDDDASWDRFMAYLQAKMRDVLEMRGANDVYEQLDWKVQEGTSLWDASTETVKM